jgi:anti-anti-sigma regulatory factor
MMIESPLRRNQSVLSGSMRPGFHQVPHRCAISQDDDRSSAETTFNLRRFECLDTDGVVMILQAVRALRSRGGTVRLCHVSERVRWRLELAGVYRLVESDSAERSDDAA